MLVSGLRVLPVSLQEATIPLWAALFYPQLPHIRAALRSNLARLTTRQPPEGGDLAPRLALEAAAFRTFVNYCRCVARAYRFYLGQAPPPSVVRGAEHLHQALARGRGAVLVTGHLGNWQVGQHLLARHGLPPVTVVMAEEPDRQAQQLEETLRAPLLRVVHPGRSPLVALGLRAALARGELVALQLDRPPRRGRIAVAFAGGQAALASGPAELARACGAPVVPVFFPTVAGRVEVRVQPPLEADPALDRQTATRELTARLGQIYEAQVLACPEQWYQFFSFWCDGETAHEARR